MNVVPSISVAIATRDRPDALLRCLNGLAAGTRLPAEVVVVDQSEAVTTQQLLQQRRLDLPSLRYVRQERRGLSAARNEALAIVQTPIVAITDDDCVPDAAWVAALEQTFTLPCPPDVVTGRVLPLGPSQPDLYAVSSRDSTVRKQFSSTTLPWLVGTGGNMAFNIAWAHRFGTFDERLGAGSPGKAAEDMDLIYRLLRAGAHITYEPDVLILHERQSKARRTASRFTYGHGIGAFCGIWLRRHDYFAAVMLGAWVRQQCQALGTALVQRQWNTVYEHRLCLRGTLRGLVYGLRVLKQ